MTGAAVGRSPSFADVAFIGCLEVVLVLLLVLYLGCVFAPDPLIDEDTRR